MNEKKLPANITQKDGYVEIEFSESMPKDAIEKQVNQCIAETCDCCTPEFREKVVNFDVSELSFNKVKVYGTISEDEVKGNVLSCAPKLKRK
ncbi:hypothetical protein [Helicovermis profundi]|uniref:Uncharacterized protein n=1 Tax=Helicovermis profundi TaxID=3065157 RepID=A0AAU9ER30_9FIRM|nr:hypothetical protein HLPR_21570 [Clostridia bacterium S502]